MNNFEVHSNAKAKTLGCKYCDRSYTSGNGLNNHMNQKHPEKKAKSKDITPQQLVKATLLATQLNKASDAKKTQEVWHIWRRCC